jgi:hypothetical protein
VEDVGSCEWTGWEPKRLTRILLRRGLIRKLKVPCLGSMANVKAATSLNLRDTFNSSSVRRIYQLSFLLSLRFTLCHLLTGLEIRSCRSSFIDECSDGEALERTAIRALSMMHARTGSKNDLSQ